MGKYKINFFLCTFHSPQNFRNDKRVERKMDGYIWFGRLSILYWQMTCCCLNCITIDSGDKWRENSVYCGRIWQAGEFCSTSDWLWRCCYHAWLDWCVRFHNVLLMVCFLSLIRRCLLAWKIVIDYHEVVSWLVYTIYHVVCIQRILVQARDAFEIH